MHFYDFERLSIQLKGELKLFQLAQTLVKANESDHIFAALVALILLEKLKVEVHLVHVQIAVWTQKCTTFAIVLNMPRQAILKHTYIYGAERALLLLRAPRARAKVPFSIFVVECRPAIIRTVELAHIEQVVNMP